MDLSCDNAIGIDAPDRGMRLSTATSHSIQYNIYDVAYLLLSLGNVAHVPMRTGVGSNLDLID